MFDWLSVLEVLSNREKAILVWAGIAVLFVSMKADGIGGNLRGVASALATRKLALLFGSATLYAAAVILLGYELGVWRLSALKATGYWFFATAVVLVGNAVLIDAGERIRPRELLRGAIRLTILVEFLVNLYVFPFLVEFLLLIPALTILLVLEAWDQHAPSDPRLTRFISRALSFVGLTLLTYVAVSALADLGEVLTRESAEEILVPPALTLALVPFLYGAAWVSRREQERLRRRFRPLSSRA